MSSPRFLILGAALTVAILAGCASTTGGDGSASGPSSTPSFGDTPTSRPAPTTPFTPGPPRISVPPVKPTGDGEITVTGQVDYIEIEGGCLVLRVGSQTYQLMGADKRTARPGVRLTVRGKIRNDVLTICQVGPVLEVIEARAA